MSALVPGIYEGLPMGEYLAMPAASASTLITLLQRCPLAAWHESWMNPMRPATVSTREQSIGTLAHELFLEGRNDRLEVIDPADHPAKTSGNIPTGWTNNAIRAARDAALARGKIPVLPEFDAAVKAMVSTAKGFVETVRIDEPEVFAMFQPGGGRSEVTIVWEEDGCFFRIRPDRLNTAMTLIGDMKTTASSAEPDRWGRTQLFGQDYFIAAAFYRRGLRAITGKTAEYVFLAQEQDPPYLPSLVGLDRTAWALGAAKVERAVTIWKECVRSGRWPAYPARVVYPELPSYRLGEEELGSTGNVYDYGEMGWKKPEKLGFDHEHDPI